VIAQRVDQPEAESAPLPGQRTDWGRGDGVIANDDDERVGRDTRLEHVGRIALLVAVHHNEGGRFVHGQLHSRRAERFGSARRRTAEAGMRERSGRRFAADPHVHGYALVAARIARHQGCSATYPASEQRRSRGSAMPHASLSLKTTRKVS
jgi:hypothetical protein